MLGRCDMMSGSVNPDVICKGLVKIITQYKNGNEAFYIVVNSNRVVLQYCTLVY